MQRPSPLRCVVCLALLTSLIPVHSGAQEPSATLAVEPSATRGTMLLVGVDEQATAYRDLEDETIAGATNQGRLAVSVVQSTLRAEVWVRRDHLVTLRFGGGLGMGRVMLRSVKRTPARLFGDDDDPDAGTERRRAGGFGPVLVASVTAGVLFGGRRLSGGPTIQFDWARLGTGREPVPGVDGGEFDVPKTLFALSIGGGIAIRLGSRPRAPRLLVSLHFATPVQSAGIGISLRLLAPVNREDRGPLE